MQIEVAKKLGLNCTDRISKCEKGRPMPIGKDMPNCPMIFFQGQELYYDVAKDHMLLPQLKSFKKAEKLLLYPLAGTRIVWVQKTFG